MVQNDQNSYWDTGRYDCNRKMDHPSPGQIVNPPMPGHISQIRISPRRAYRPASKSSQTTPYPRGSFCDLPAGNGLMISNSRNKKKASTIPRRVGCAQTRMTCMPTTSSMTMHLASRPYAFSNCVDTGTEATRVTRATKGLARTSPPGTRAYTSTKMKLANVAGAIGKKPVNPKVPMSFQIKFTLEDPLSPSSLVRKCRSCISTVQRRSRQSRDPLSASAPRRIDFYLRLQNFFREKILLSDSLHLYNEFSFRSTRCYLKPLEALLRPHLHFAVPAFFIRIKNISEPVIVRFSYALNLSLRDPLIKFPTAFQISFYDPIKDLLFLPRILLRTHAMMLQLTTVRTNNIPHDIQLP